MVQRPEGALERGGGDCERCAAGWQVTQMNRPRKSVSNLLLTERYLVPLLLTGVRLHPPGRTDENLCRCFGAPARRVFPDHLITLLFFFLASYIC